VAALLEQAVAEVAAQVAIQAMERLARQTQAVVEEVLCAAFIQAAQAAPALLS
jgi:hypothetical protein